MLAIPIDGFYLHSYYEKVLLNKIESEPVLLTYLPPYVSAETVALNVLKLKDLSRSRVLSISERFTANVHDSWFVESLSEVLGQDYDQEGSLDDFIISNTDYLRSPSIIIVSVAGRVTQARLDGLCTLCNRAATYTKDLEGPLRFIVLVESPTLKSTLSLSEVVWEPTLPSSIPFRLDDASFSFEPAGFSIYMAHKVYWEGSGRLDLINLFHEQTIQAQAYIQRPKADDFIDKMLDRAVLLDEEEGRRLADICLSNIDPAIGRKTLLSGIINRSRLANKGDLISNGLCWNPPGSMHLHITVLAARHLCANSRICSEYGLTGTDFDSIVRASRYNPMIGNWVMGLTSLIELEMLTACRNSDMTNDIFSRLGYLDDLTVQSRKARLDMMYNNRLDLVDFATFHQLLETITHGAFRVPFPISRERLCKIRDIRNMVAHLHHVRWDSIKDVLNSLQTVSAR